MKTTNLILVTGLFLASCGGSSTPGACSAHPLVGSWINENETDIYKFNGDCTGSSTYCESTFTYPNSTATSGSALFTVTSSNGAEGCLPIGQTTCAYAIEGTAFAADCGLGAIIYTKQ
jgi:hypothetical protein